MVTLYYHMATLYSTGVGIVEVQGQVVLVVVVCVRGGGRAGTMGNGSW